MDRSLTGVLVHSDTVYRFPAHKRMGMFHAEIKFPVYVAGQEPQFAVGSAGLIDAGLTLVPPAPVQGCARAPFNDQIKKLTRKKA